MATELDDRDFVRLHGPDGFDFEDDEDRADSPTIGTSYAEEEAETKRLAILATYQDVWREFYDWEPEYCSQLIQSATYANPLPHTIAFPVDIESDDMDVDEVDATATNEGGMFTMCTWDGTEFEDFSKDSLVCEVPRGDRMARRIVPFAEHRLYESCTPFNANIYPNVSNTKPACKFIKYSDDLNFDSREYMKQFHSIDWQKDWRDPDFCVIAVAVIRRLTAWANAQVIASSEITLADIEEAHVFPIPADEIVDSMLTRDELFWPGAAFTRTEDARRQISVSASFAGMTASFCARPNCIQAECFLDPFPTGWIPGHELATDANNDEYKASVLANADEGQGHEPCGPECFLQPVEHNIGHLIEESIDKDALLLLDYILAFAPDELPCRIGKVLQNMIPCYLIFLRRSVKVEVRSRRDRELRAKPASWVDGTEQAYMPVRCMHTGPCSRQNCVCFQHRVHCQRNCLCNKDCALRAEACGCNISERHQKCSKEDCACAKRSWECNAELCNHLSKEKLHIDRLLCNNVDMQCRLPAAFEIRSGSYGLGGYALKNIAKDTYIGEYICELYELHIAGLSGLYQRHSRYNYTFTLNSELAGDAQHVGNDTRYFNHSPSDPNIEPRVILVNGEQRIAFYSIVDIKEKEEIVFNYGEAYWKNQ